MTLVDSSVWIDYFRGVPNPETDHLDGMLGSTPVGIGDLMITEVLQGFTSDREFESARMLLTSLNVVPIGGLDSAVQAARNFRLLRSKGVTVRKTIDTLIATRCISDGFILLFSDRDFDAFVEHLGLQSAIPEGQ